MKFHTSIPGSLSGKNLNRKRLRQEIIRGCREMAEVYLAIEKEYHPLEEEVHKALFTRRKTRRGRA
jgi:hypothetical protein